MNLNNENVTVIDSNSLVNGVMRDIEDVGHMEKTLETDLTSEELFRIDCAILSSLRSTKDFSRDLLFELESGKLECFSGPPVQKNDIDETVMNALQEMFYHMAEYVDGAMF